MSIRDLVSKQLETAAKVKDKPNTKEAPKVEKTETAADAGDFAWYVYSSSVGSKLNNDSENELILTEGSSFGIRPTEGSEETMDLVSEDIGLDKVFRLSMEAAATIVERSTEAEREDDSEDESSGEE